MFRSNPMFFMVLFTVLILSITINCSNQSIHKIEKTQQLPNTKEDALVNQFKNNKKEGLWRVYYANGNLKNEYSYRNNKKEGWGKEWWEDGKLASEGMYKDGKANGLMKWYSPKGHLAATGNMVGDKRNGTWKIFDWQDSTFYTIGSFINEVEEGIWKSYYGNGQVERENVWRAGKIIDSKCWDEKGNKIDCP